MALHKLEILIDKTRHEVAGGVVPGRDLLALAGVSAPAQLLLDIDNEVDIPIAPDDLVVIRGGERFVVGDGSPPVDDNPCVRTPIPFHLNGAVVPETQRFHHAKATGAQLKALDPNVRPGDQLWFDLKGFVDEPLRDEQRIVLQRHDRFIVVPCGNVGLLDLVADAVAKVAREYPGAELICEGAARYLVVPKVPVAPAFVVPAGQTLGETTILVVVPSGYPMAAPDMFWVEPALRLSGGGEPQGAACYETMAGRTWQRFSWHYAEGGAAWRPGASDLLSHVAFCRARLQRAH